MGMSSGGGQANFSGERRVHAEDVAVPPGYRVEVVASGLTFPTGITFDDQGRAHVTESGYSYGEVWAQPRLIRLGSPNRIVATGGRNGPWNGVVHHQGAFFIAEGGKSEGGKILRVGPNGKTTVLVRGLPSYGDHHTNGPAIGPDGYVYFGQGTATNSGVVGKDNREHGWLDPHPGFHDTAAEALVLKGLDYGGREAAPTGAFQPYGKTTVPGQRVPATANPTGSILRVLPSGGRAELVASGFRNPFGLAFSPAGALFATDNGYDNRGSRPVWGAGDLLWKVRRGAWHGWPDFAGNMPLDDPFFRPPWKKTPGFVLERHPNPAPAPAAFLAVHSSSNGLDFSRSRSFGHFGEAFIAQFGDMAPEVNRVMAPVGFKVVRVNVHDGSSEDFAVNRHGSGPASKVGGGGLERPVAARFSPDGKALYVVDFGVMTMEGKKPKPRAGTGVVWKISKEGGRP